jgi:putative modified peptide
MSNEPIVYAASPDSAWELLNKLATDDSFRADLERDPAGTLARSNIAVGSLPSRINLPSKQEIAAAMSQAGVSTAGQQVQPAAAHVAFLAFFAFMR